MRRIYMIVVGSGFNDLNRLHTFISTHQKVEDWWHHLDTAYIVVSTVSIADMQDEIVRQFPGQHFLVIDIYPKVYGGWLAQGAWDWLSKFRTWRFDIQT